jgi:hypothetical protein
MLNKVPTEWFWVFPITHYLVNNTFFLL